MHFHLKVVFVQKLTNMQTTEIITAITERIAFLACNWPLIDYIKNQDRGRYSNWNRQ